MRVAMLLWHPCYHQQPSMDPWLEVKLEVR